MAGEIGRVRVRSLHAILLDPRDPLAGSVSKVGLRRLRIGIARDHQRLAALVHRRGVVETGIGQAHDLRRRREIERIDLLRQHAVLRTGEEHAAGLLVHADKAGHHPVALRQLLPLAVRIMVGPEAVEMAEAIAFGPPDEAAIRQKAIAVRQVDPAAFGGLFTEQHASLARGGIDRQHVEPGLRAVSRWT
jgi:hypothetical protein